MKIVISHPDRNKAIRGHSALPAIFLFPAACQERMHVLLCIRHSFFEKIRKREHIKCLVFLFNADR